jgi:hypothetical protein
MNDLAEQALHALDTARRKVAARPLPSLSLAGFVAAATTVYFGGQLGAAPAALPLNGWLGLLPERSRLADGLAGGLMFTGIALLVVLWLLALRVLRGDGRSDRYAWTLAGVWGLPFVVGPPLLSTDVYSYAAHGLLSRSGIDPYAHGPAALGDIPIVTAIDPVWRGAASTAGPLATFGEHFLMSVTNGHPLATVLMLRALAVAGVVAAGLLAAELSGPRRVPALSLIVLNPAVLLLVVSGAHLEGVLAALLLATLVAASRRRWLLAIVLACAAAGLKPVAIIAVPALVLAHCQGHRPRAAWRIAARDVSVAAAVLCAFVFAVPDGLGWMRNLGTVTREHTPFSPASAVAEILSPIVPSASFDDLAVGGRIAVVFAAAAVVLYLLVSAARRPTDRTIGYGLLAIGLLSPVVYPTYLLWGVVCLAPTAIGVRRDWVIALSCAAVVLTPAGFGQRTAHAITAVTLAVVACVLLGCLLAHRQARAQLVRRVISGG